MAFCAFCGKEIPTGASFCPACGKSVAASAASSGSGQLPPVPAGAGPNLATEGDRIIAVIIDTILISVVSLVIFIPLWLLGGFFGFFGSFAFVFFGPITLLSWLLWLLYFTYFESTTGQTLGKQPVNIRVVGEPRLPHLAFSRA